MQELMSSWWTFGVFAVIALVGVWLLFRSFRKWQQPPSGTGAEARDAEMKLKTMSKRSGGTWSG